MKGLLTQSTETLPIWKPQAGPQEQAIRTAGFVDEALYGGAAGGGKTSFLIGDYASDIDQGAAWVGILFRQSYPELDDIISQTHEVYPQLGGEYKVGAHEWHFKSGAILRLRHAENELDFTKYQGASYAWIAFDEMTNWGDLKFYKKMKSRLRGPAKRKRIRCTANPGGIGHDVVKQYFINAAPPLTLIQGETTPEGDASMSRMFIPAKVQDNKILLENDPGYIARLREVGDPDLVKAWLEGDWNSIVGAYFSQWDKRVEVPSFVVPEHWPLLGCMDYGEAAPTAFYLATQDYDGNTYFITEYYRDNATASQHAYEINKLIDGCPFTGGRRPTSIICDPSMFTKRRLTEVINHSPADIFRESGLYLTRGANERVAGWRVINDALSKERMYCFAGWCDNLVRTMPSIPRDRKNPEDIDTHSDDHAADAIRYMMMHIYKASRPPTAKSRDPKTGANVLKSLRTKKRKARYAA